VRRNPIASGAAFALASAVAFGASTPLVQRLGRGVGPFTTAALLYAGSLLVFVAPGRGARETPLRMRDAGRLVTVALLGAVAAPMALAWGLQRTSGVTASLSLNLEALFTVLLARVLWHENIGPRVGLAVVAMFAAGVLIVMQGRATSLSAGWGALAVVGATLAWACDSTLGRPLADRNPTHVVMAKGAIGAALSLVVARGAGERLPSAATVAGLAACGAIGYGLSLRLYLQAQRVIGAARTGSIFAVAPFLGAAIAWAMGERAGVLVTVGAASLCAVGVWLHITEKHEHPHTHDALEHEHAHRHDDGHHEHAHDRDPVAEHSHPHRHEERTHAHPHAPDVHHRHGHGGE